MRLDGKVGIVVGAGQSRDETVGTGRAAAIVFAREGARVKLADRDLPTGSPRLASTSSATRSRSTTRRTASA